MPASFWTHYLVALAAVALILGGLFAVARSSSRWRVHAFPNRRFLGVVETFVLSPHAQLHVVRAGSRYVLVGVTPHGIALLRDSKRKRLPRGSPLTPPARARRPAPRRPAPLRAARSTPATQRSTPRSTAAGVEAATRSRRRYAYRRSPDPVLSPTRHASGIPSRVAAIPVLPAISHETSRSRDCWESSEPSDDRPRILRPSRAGVVVSRGSPDCRFVE